MRVFAELFESLDTTTSTLAKVEAMVAYFRAAKLADAAWAVHVLIGRRLKRSIGPALLRSWLLEEADLPAWLIEETYGSVGDLAETIALLVPGNGAQAAQHAEVSLAAWFQRILTLPGLELAERRSVIVSWWHQLPYRECFLVNKLLTGSLRVGVSRGLVTRALAECLNQPRIQIERALIGNWQPSAEFWQALVNNQGNLHVAHPYPFFLASPLDGAPAALGDRLDWLAEWKWDGMRGQIVRRAGECSLWSRGEEVVTERFPEIVNAAAALADGCVLDGEILAWRDGRVLPFARLQQRFGRSKLTPKILVDIPVRFVAYDLLELNAVDLRPRTLRERRRELDLLLTRINTPALMLSPPVLDESWNALCLARDQARARGVEGLMLKQWQSPYGTGRQRGAWWKWKVDPFTFDGVLLYAAPGHGRRSNLYTDYTFGVWNGESLVPVAKAYSGLTDNEIRSLDKWIRSHTKEKFGTVRSVDAAQVFEIAFEGIASSSRHKSGIAMRFPRILRWRTDKAVADVDTLAALQQLLAESLVSG